MRDYEICVYAENGKLEAYSHEMHLRDQSAIQAGKRLAKRSPFSNLQRRRLCCISGTRTRYHCDRPGVGWAQRKSAFFQVTGRPENDNRHIADGIYDLRQSRRHGKS